MVFKTEKRIDYFLPGTEPFMLRTSGSLLLLEEVIKEIRSK